MQKTVILTLKETLSGNGQVDRIFMNMKKEINTRGYSDPILGLHTYVYDLCSQKSLLVYISDLR